MSFEKNYDLINQRKKLNLTRKELGEMIGVKSRTISEYENGTRNPCSYRMYSISVALNSTMDELFSFSLSKQINKMNLNQCIDKNK